MKKLCVLLTVGLSMVLQDHASADETVSSSVSTDAHATAVKMAREMADAMAADPDAIPPEVAGFAAMMAAAIESASLESSGIKGTDREAADPSRSE